MEKYKTSEKIEQWIKDKMTHKLINTKRNKDKNSLNKVFNKYDSLMSKYKISADQNKALRTNKSQKKVNANGLQGKHMRTIDTKRVFPSTNKSGHDPYKIQNVFNKRKISSPSPHLNNVNSYINYNQHSNFPQSPSSCSKKSHNLSSENLKNLKSNRSKRKALYRERSDQGSLKISPTTPTAPNPTFSQKKGKFILPATEASRRRNLFKDKNCSSNSNHLRSQSIESQISPNLKVNIWANEQKNKIHRYRKTEEMRGVLNRQKEEKLAREALQQQNTKKELLEMQDKIKHYQEELKTEAKRRSYKKSQEKGFMEESKNLYQLNKKLHKELDRMETMKENPKYLVNRDQQERKLSHKRSYARKALDSYYLSQIQENRLRSSQLKKIDQDMANNTRSFLEKLNDQNEKDHKAKIKNCLEKNQKRQDILKSLLPKDPLEDDISRNEIPGLIQLQNYREVKRNRETKAVSLYNAMSLQGKKKHLTKLPRIIDKDSSTGLLWDSNSHLDTIIKKGKLNQEGLKYLRMNPLEKRKDIDSTLKAMISQKDQKKRDQKVLDAEEYIETNKEMYYPQGLELF
ncbi:unnamed protein product [Moneuplotes crassus]|uniref:Uncharacterized protein n=1 Tax=Euplotes crassus TaxID=5936 RepID=A0AAD1X8P7_EUPCR|nr:unnamed protein product [Moneuplotes crassus]